jgi:hypothetical protein
MTTQASSLNEFLGDFRSTVVDATERLRAISSDRSAQKLSPDQWSIREVLGHLIDSAANNHQRFVRAQFTDDLVFPGYEQEKWVNAQRYNEESWSDMVQLWSSYNLHLLHVIASIPEATLMRARIRHNLDQIALHPVDKNDPTTLDYFVRDYLVHMKHHLDQIFAMDSN